MDIVFKWERAIKPMDRYPITLHSPKPSHLPFRETANIRVEIVKHLIIRAIALKVTGDMTIFQSISQETLGRDTLKKERLDLINHTLLKTLTKTDTDTSDNLIAREIHTHNQMPHGREIDTVVRVRMLVLLNFKSPHKSITRFGVSMVMELDIGGKSGNEFVVGERLQGAPIPFVDGRIR